MPEEENLKKENLSKDLVIGTVIGAGFVIAYTLVFNAELCKGCELCVLECPKKVIEMSSILNHMGYLAAHYLGEGPP